jgi:hypothetical protein
VVRGLEKILFLQFNVHDRNLSMQVASLHSGIAAPRRHLVKTPRG